VDIILKHLEAILIVYMQHMELNGMAMPLHLMDHSILLKMAD